MEETILEMLSTAIQLAKLGGGGSGAYVFFFVVNRVGIPSVFI